MQIEVTLSVYESKKLHDCWWILENTKKDSNVTCH